MKKVTVILAHPFYANSNANKIIVDSLKGLENVEVRHIDELYPDGKIDVEAEQGVLIESDLIVFQFPLFWFNIPASLKNWLDSVFTYGFAFGSTGDKLKGKDFLVSTTIGGPEETYTSGGLSIEALLLHLTAIGGFTGMNNMEMIKTFGMSFVPGNDANFKVQQEAAKKHADKLADVLKK